MYIDSCEMSCGVYQICGLGTYGANPVDKVLVAIGVYDGGERAVAGYTFLFSDRVEYGNGQKLAESLKLAKVGIVRSWGKRKNPNHDSIIEIWEFKLNKKGAARANKLAEEAGESGDWHF
jgi:hypothetical protein